MKAAIHHLRSARVVLARVVLADRLSPGPARLLVPLRRSASCQHRLPTRLSHLLMPTMTGCSRPARTSPCQEAKRTTGNSHAGPRRWLFDGHPGCWTVYRRPCDQCAKRPLPQRGRAEDKHGSDLNRRAMVVAAMGRRRCHLNLRDRQRVAG